MRRHVPLNAARAFEAAARHMSFVRAADELCVTPTAISHHVKSLEDFLQVRLFDRKHGRLSLTPAATQALEALTEGFERLDSAFAPIDRRKGRQSVTVAATPSFAAAWLAPKSLRFVAAEPDIDVKVVSAVANHDYITPDVDIAIYNWTKRPQGRVDFIMEEHLVPVCAPSLLPADGLAGASVLSTLPLIHVDLAFDGVPNWPRYLAEVGLKVANANRGLRFTQSSIAIDAAIKGYGVLLARDRLVCDALKFGQLQIVGEPFPASFHYYLVRNTGMRSRAVTAFVDWLIAEARKDEEFIADLQGAFAPRMEAAE